MQTYAEPKEKHHGAQLGSSLSRSSDHAAAIPQLAPAGAPSQVSQLQAMLNSRPAAKQIRQFQQMANRGPQARGVAQLQERMNRGNGQVAQLNGDDIRKRLYSKIGHLAMPGVKDDRPLPQPKTVRPLYDPIPVEGEKQAEKRYINSKLDELFALGTSSAGNSSAPDIITPTAITIIAQDKLCKNMGSGYGDYGNSCRAQAPGVLKLAYDKGYDIWDEAVLKLIAAILIMMQSISYTTTMGNYKGSWPGGSFQ